MVGPMDTSPFVEMSFAYPQLFRSPCDWDLATESAARASGTASVVH
jgi:hypothetical protein